jgi:hypothetical protein
MRVYREKWNSLADYLWNNYRIPTLMILVTIALAFLVWFLIYHTLLFFAIAITCIVISFIYSIALIINDAFFNDSER